MTRRNGIRICGHVGNQDVDLVIVGVTLTDLFAAAIANGLVSEHVVGDTPREAKTLARRADRMAVALSAARNGSGRR